ncbi:MAG: acetyltransferase [Actinobacteria bacterium]|nr:acetyltransferase [Actinomycetota bacterium]
MPISYEWRGEFSNPDLDSLHAEGFGHGPSATDWQAQLTRHSLGWVCARDGGELVGFVNVAWDGGAHAFLLDTLTARRVQGQGVGTALVARAAEGARAAGCEWLHVDFDQELDSFYLDACGFSPTPAGLIRL